jgi:hydrogenase/urease accessory protein HupE
MRKLLRAAISFAVLTLATPAGAHPLAPALLELRETAAHRIEVTWRRSILVRPGTAETRPVLPDYCVESGPRSVSEDDEGITATWQVDCGTRGLVGARVGVEGLGQAFSDALVRLVLADGRTVRAVISSGDPFVTVPARESKSAVAKGYAKLGIGHILTGVDHLLFVFGLLLLVPSRRLLLATITSFTVGHSITLSLAALGVTALPQAPIETAIALSIYVLAVDLARERRATGTLLSRRPWVMALLFGLLHGMGFAGALREIGLPQQEIPLSLLSFNAGIEIGQLAFVVTVLALHRALRPLLATLPSWSRRVPVYAMGSLAVFWMIERSSLF